MARRSITKNADVGDNYESLAKLFELDRAKRVRILEGELQFRTSGVTYVYTEAGTAPASGEVGIEGASGQSRTFGPDSPWRLDQIWVKETTGGGGAKVIFAGVVEE